MAWIYDEDKGVQIKVQVSIPSQTISRISLTGSGQMRSWPLIVKAKIATKVREEDLMFINPLSVAVNSKGKLRLCIDLTRRFNKVTKTQKFKIESTREALQVIKQGYWMFSFDLKSAYLMIPVTPVL